MRRALALSVALAAALCAVAGGAARAEDEGPQITKPPKLVTFVPAVYPKEKHDAHLTGSVLLSIEIGDDGKVGEVEVVKGAAPDFDAAAVAAAKQFVFEPAEIDHQPAPVKITYRYDFTIVEQIVKAGPQINFDGVVLERLSKKPLPRVSVKITDLEGAAAVTDADGRFAFTDVPVGTHKMQLSHPKLITVITEETIAVGKRRTVKYLVEEKDDDDEGISIVVRAPRIKKEAVETRIRTEEARRVPGTQGDTLKVVQNLPGVARSSFGSGELIVWGAAPNETKVNVDGVEIPALYHVGGFRSTINSDLVRSINLSPGAYGADYGRGLGGLVRIDLGAAPQPGDARLRRRRQSRRLRAALDGDHPPSAAGGRGPHQLPRPAAAAGHLGGRRRLRPHPPLRRLPGARHPLPAARRGGGADLSRPPTITCAAPSPPTIRARCAPRTSTADGSGSSSATRACSPTAPRSS